MKTKTLVTILKYAASIGILTWLIWSRWEQFAKFYEQEKNLWWLAAALCTIIMGFMLSFLRWYQLANAIRLELTFAEATKLGFIGHFFNVVAFGVVGGDSLRAFYAARSKKDRVPEAILSVFIDRAIGLMVMCGFAGIGWQINLRLGGAPAVGGDHATISGICSVAGILSLLGAIVLLSFLMFPGIRKAAPFRALSRIPKFGGIIERGMDAAALYSSNKSTIVLAILLSIATNILFAFTIWLVSLGVSTSPPTFFDHLVMAPISMVANSVPLPGGVGGMEFALAAMYESYGASGGVIVAICFRLCILFVSMLGWIVWLVGGGEKMRSDSQDTSEKVVQKQV